MRKFAIAMAAVLVATVALSPISAFAQTEKIVTAGAAGTFPTGATYGGISLQGLRFGLGVTISSSGASEGDFQTTLLGTSLGQPQQIVVVGKAFNGLVPAPGTATFSGTATVKVGSGPPVPGVPFTATIVPNADEKGTLTLILNTTNLPAATVTLGSMTVK